MKMKGMLQMLSVNFYNTGEIKSEKLKFAVIVSNYQDKWILVRHKDRKTWEIPGGHIEEFEDTKDTAYRELYEETGAKEVELTPICTYSVKRDQEDESFGQLYYAKVIKISDIPESSEIADVKLFNSLPEELTYPLIQPKLYQKVLNYIDI